jgi:geranylgeranyl diphosphate synthase type II
VTTTGDTDFHDMLAAYNGMARRAAAAYLPDTGDDANLAAPTADYLHRGGKGLRPALCLAACEAFGGTVSRALPTAAALELLHTAFLVHDDVEDDSELRRGEPTLHRRYGAPVAINAGDAVAVFALRALRENDVRLGPRLSGRIWAEFEFMARQTVAGQAAELGWQADGRVDVTPDDYLDLIMRKTCWYTTVLPLRAGALIGGSPAPDLDALLRFGFFLGAAFQIRDDILNLTAGEGRYGKEPLGDLREGKRTLMLIHLLAAAGDERAEVLHFLRQERCERSAAACRRIMSLMQHHGSVAFADHFAHGIAESARAAFDAAFAEVPDSPQRRFIADLVGYMVSRGH